MSFCTKTSQISTSRPTDNLSDYASGSGRGETCDDGRGIFQVFESRLVG